MKQKFDVTGMTCSACSAHVEKAVGKLEGIQTVNVNLLQNSMVVEYDDTALSADDIINAVKSCVNAKIIIFSCPRRIEGRGAPTMCPMET